MQIVKLKTLLPRHELLRIAHERAPVEIAEILFPLRED